MFRYPLILLGLLPLAALLWWKIRRQPRLKVGYLPAFSRLPPTFRSRYWWMSDLWLGGIGVLLVALLAGPQGIEPPEGSFRGARIALVLDRSASMGAEIDTEAGPRSRFEAVKAVLKTFLSRRQGDAVTLISFATTPATHAPLTRDLGLVSDYLDLIPLSPKGPTGGTALGDALVLASARLQEQEDTSGHPGVIVVVTDGQGNTGRYTSRQAADLAKTLGQKIFAVALGDSGLFGQTRVDTDVRALKEVGDVSGGGFFQVRAQKELELLIQNLEEESFYAEGRTAVVQRMTLGPWVVVLGILLILFPFLNTILFRRVRLRVGTLVLPVLTGAAALGLLAVPPLPGLGAVSEGGDGQDTVFLVDVSRSMLAQDILPDRLSALRSELATLDLKSDRAGMIAYAGTPVLLSPMSKDPYFFRQTVERLTPGVVAQGGSRLGEAMRLADAAFGRRGKNLTFWILTDGGDQEGGATEAVKLLKGRKHRVLIYGIGTEEGAPVPERDAVTALDSGLLMGLATEGENYFTGNASDFSEIYQRTRKTGSQWDQGGADREESLWFLLWFLVPPVVFLLTVRPKLVRRNP